MVETTRRHWVCPLCGATNVGSHMACLRCQAPLPEEVDFESAQTCAQCGRQLSPESRFCDRCGSALISEPAPAPLTCSECGTQMPPGKRFCTQCGASLAGPEGG